MTLAAIDLDSLFPLIIGLIWVIAQIAGAAAKKKSSPTRPAPVRTGDEDAVEDPFADLMRKLGGVQEFKMPTPPEREEIKPPLPQKPERIAALPNVAPIRQKTAIPEPEPVQAPPVDARPKMSSFKQAMPSIRMPAMNLHFQTLEKSDSGLPRIGRIIDPSDKQTLRRSVLGHIILSKPKALEGWGIGRVD